MKRRDTSVLCLKAIEEMEADTSTRIAATAGIVQSRARVIMSKHCELGNAVCNQHNDPQGRVVNLYSITQRGKNWLLANVQIDDADELPEPTPNAATVRAHCNFSQSAPYVPPAWQPARHDADDNQQYRSRGV